MPIIECNGADLYYEEYGAGVPIVRLHGVFAGIRHFQLQIEELSAEYRTIPYDFRGHGRSEKVNARHTVPNT